LAILLKLQGRPDRDNEYIYLSLHRWFCSSCRLLLTFINNCHLVWFNFLQFMLVACF
jgi:hypothetical protein